jgi:hypothetical protein
VIPVIPVVRIQKRLLGSGYPAHWIAALTRAIGAQKNLSGEKLADIIEDVAEELDEWTLEQWGEIVLRLAPEMFGTPRQSYWPTDAPGGSYEKIRRLRRRAAKGLNLWQPQDDSKHAEKNVEPQAKSIPLSRQPAGKPKPARSRVRQRVDSVQQAVPTNQSAVPDVRPSGTNDSGNAGRSHPAAETEARPAPRQRKPSADVPQLPRRQNGSRDEKPVKGKISKGIKNSKER